MNMRLGELENELEDDEARRNLRQSFSRLRSLTGRDGRDFELGSMEKMGQAAGIHYNADDRVEIRPDIVQQAMEGGANNTDHFLHITAHEVIHDDQTNEGWTEWLATLLTHTEAIEAVVGRETLKENALEEDGKLAVLQDYVQKRVAQGMDWLEAAAECNEHFDQAEDYAA